jgi:3-deoxy-D-manno-octulosonic-acid transferase
MADQTENPALRRAALAGWRLLYALLLLIARPLVRLRLAYRARRDPAYGDRIQERFALLPEGLPRGGVWFHTVSAGETIAAAPIILALADRHPDVPVLVTTMTPTGSAQVVRLLDDRVAHCYAPYDFPAVVARFFDRTAPRLLVLMETELWPNMLQEAARRDVPVLLVNARLSARSAAGYARIGALTRSMLESLRFIACQYADHAERFLALGAPADRVGALGSVKFDVRLPDDHRLRVQTLRQNWGLEGRPVWIAGSTHPGEEEIVLAAHQQLKARFPELLLILVPRHPERRGEVGTLIDQAGFSQAWMSEVGAPAGRDVVLGDTMGELLYLYGLADVAFLGGSLVSVGGHNPIEAAVCRIPLIMGPETFNFPDVVAAFGEAGCLHLISDAASLADRVAGYLADDGSRLAAGELAADVVARNRGATDRLLELLSAEVRAADQPVAGKAAG